jgi:Zinc finger, C2H2 type
MNKMCAETSTSTDNLAKIRPARNEIERKYPCQLCQRRFFTRKDVERHQVVHTGRRDFPCSECQQRFGRKDHVIRHMRKAHGLDDRCQFRLSVAFNDVVEAQEVPHVPPDDGVSASQLVPVTHLPTSCVARSTCDVSAGGQVLDDVQSDTWHLVANVDDSIYQPTDTFPIELANELHELGP